MKMYIAGQWIDSDKKFEVKSPYYGDVQDTVPESSLEDVERCLAAAVAGAKSMAALTGYDRQKILEKAGQLLDEQVEEMARTVSLEQGKPITEARGEASRMGDLFRLCAFEGSQLRGEMLPVDAQVGAAGKIGMAIHVPCGVVLAITPFNYPLLLVAHKIGPALAAGNAVILKPAEQTSMCALKLTKILYDAGLPENGLQCITGSGSRIGDPLCSDSRVRKITFTGSTTIGTHITSVAGVKKFSLELGSNAPVVVLPDADIEKVAAAVAIGGFINAGQVCISNQRVIVQKGIYNEFIEALKPKVEALKVGPSLEEDTKLSAMISEKDAIRVGEWIDDAVKSGARVVTGGKREGTVFHPTIVADVDPGMRISCEELFGPAVGVTPVETIDEAIALCNDSTYGLGAGIFTQDINNAWRFAREVESGNIMINWTPLWRADLQPYGGFKMSGIGREGPRYAIQEMTELKTIVFHGV